MNFTDVQSPNMASPWNTRVAPENDRSNAEMLATTSLEPTGSWNVMGGHLCCFCHPLHVRFQPLLRPKWQFLAILAV